jgi:carbamoyltransferase
VSEDLWVAGLNHGAHDSAAALLRNGRLVATVEQERLSRRKRALNEPPVDALKWCLDQAGITLSELAAIGLGSDLDVLGEWMGLSPQQRRVELPLDDPERLLPPKMFGTERPRIIPVRHHLAHAASCYWPSGFEEAAVLVIDNRGEDSATTLVQATPEGIKILKSYPIEHSLGLYYRIATQYVGLYNRGDEAGKLMGLAPYGRPTYDVALRYTSDGPLWDGVPAATTRGKALPLERTEQLLAYFEQHCYPYTRGLKADLTAYIDFAASVQNALEETILDLAQELHRCTGSRNLCLAGGVALNCSANGRLAAEGPFDNIFVQPMAHDAGVGLGAAYEVARQLDAARFQPQRMTHAYWGPQQDDDHIASVLHQQQLAIEKLSPEELAAKTAYQLSRGAIVGWHQGRAEAGPRSLGARSILGDPRRRETLVRLNNLKQREMWRPLAPSVLNVHFNKYFYGTPNPFMIVAASVRPEVRSLIPAVVHIDGSARPQVVDAADNPQFAALLSAFESETGLPILVNTSFNTAGMPIVNRPEESVFTFLNSDMDFLAIGSFLVSRPGEHL